MTLVSVWFITLWSKNRSMPSFVRLVATVLRMSWIFQSVTPDNRSSWAFAFEKPLTGLSPARPDLIKNSPSCSNNWFTNTKACFDRGTICSCLFLVSSPDKYQEPSTICERRSEAVSTRRWPQRKHSFIQAPVSYTHLTLPTTPYV